MFGRETASATVPQASHKGKGATRTCSQRSGWADRPNNLRRDELLRPIHRRFYKDDAYLSFEEKDVGGGAGKVQRVQTGSRKANWHINQEIEDRWRRREREMAEG